MNRAKALEELLGRTLAAAARRILPSDDAPGAAETGVAQGAFEILDDLGATDLSLSDLGGTSRYLVHGTCRAGEDPDTSVLDEHCRCHELPNLYVVDGSFMPTSGGASPTLTILANSFRVADHLLRRFRAGEV